MRERETEFIYCNCGTDKKRKFVLGKENTTALRMPRCVGKTCEHPACYKVVLTVYCQLHFPRIEALDNVPVFKGRLNRLLDIMSNVVEHAQKVKCALLLFDFVTLNFDMLVDHEEFTLLAKITHKYNKWCEVLGAEFAVRYAFLENPSEESLPGVVPLVDF